MLQGRFDLLDHGRLADAPWLLVGDHADRRRQVVGSPQDLLGNRRGGNRERADNLWPG